MENERKRWQGFRVPGFSVSLKAPVAILLVLFGMVPMILCTQILISSLRRSEEHTSELQSH